jgi:acyl-CoA reductase-like NAD-dependent aldehyde dehydrogenase
MECIKAGVKEGATLAYGSTPLPSEGWYISPTVLSDVTNDMTVAQEEIFGPVVCIMKYKSEEDAIAIANGTQFGLGRAYRVAEQLEAGVIWINDHHRIHPASPWGGYKDSGIGRENGIECYKDYTQVKSIIVKTASDQFDWFDGSSVEKRYS